MVIRADSLNLINRAFCQPLNLAICHVAEGLKHLVVDATLWNIRLLDVAKARLASIRLESRLIAFPACVIFPELELALGENITNVLKYNIVPLTVDVRDPPLVRRTFLTQELVVWKVDHQPLDPRQTNHARRLIKHDTATIHMRDWRIGQLAFDFIRQAINVVNLAGHHGFKVVDHNALVDVKIFPNISCRIHQGKIRKELIAVHAALSVNILDSQSAHQPLLYATKCGFTDEYGSLRADLSSRCSQKDVMLTVPIKPLLDKIFKDLKEEHVDNQ